MNKLFIDIETYNATVDLRTQGLYRYLECVEIMLVGYALNEEPAQVWDLTDSKQRIPKVLVDARENPDKYQIIAHNAAFERNVFEAIGKAWSNYALYCQWHCTMAQALAHGLPGGLQALSEIFKLSGDKAKDAENRKYISLFCKPRNGERTTRNTHPAEWSNFIEYCRRDVEAERELYKKIPSWNCTEEEKQIYSLDSVINSRGFLVDVDLAEGAIKATKEEKQQRDNKTWEATGGQVLAATQRDKMLGHLLEAYGVDLPDMSVSTLTRRLEDPDLPEPVKELIALRLQSAGTSTKKYQTLLKSVSSDGRLRGTLQYCGASRTGRWTGRIFQPQNLPRPVYPNNEIDAGIEALKAGCASYVWDNVTALASSALRGVIIAPDRKKLAVADLASIEGRVLAWLAGEEWKIKAYEDYDAGAGHDMYTLTYARTFRKDPADVTRDERQLGKVLELALGYGGGVGAFITFANGYNIDLTQLAADMTLFSMADRHASKDLWDWCVERNMTHGLQQQVFIACDCIKRMWRAANPEIAALWDKLENTVTSVLNGGQYTRAGKCSMSKINAWLRILLPSGRYLCYAGAKLDSGKMRYLGVNTYTRKWEHISTYGGKLVENITQAVSRDILAHGIVNAEKHGYQVVLSVHDELITEVPDSSEYTAERLSGIMAAVPSWAPGLPLSASGFESYRYRKD